MKKQFKTESKRILELMINSIYTNHEIFLREIISNASDAIDKLAFKALTDSSVGLSRNDFAIDIKADKALSTITVSDNGIGMTREELESNLGTIAHSGSGEYKKAMEKAEENSDAKGMIDIIGQFGVGFYSAFMVADSVEVRTRAFGSDTAYRWISSGADGYTITECDKETVGTDVIMHIKADTDDEKYSDYLEQYTISSLIKKYSDYIRYPIRMDMETSRPKEKPEDAGDDYKTEWEKVVENKTLNSMVPIWQKNKSEVDKKDYDEFYRTHFNDYEEPLSTITVNAEGAVTYRSLMFVPSRAPFDYYTREYQKGLSLYSSGVLIMERCEELLPDYFSFVKGVVDTADISLNISREMLQHTRQIKVIANNLEKRINADLMRMQREDRDKYETFFKAFGSRLKYSIASDYGMSNEKLQDLMMFVSSKEGKYVTLQEYKDNAKEDQKYIYYAAGEAEDRLAKLPQAERILNAGYEILYLTEEVDEFVMRTLNEYQGLAFKSINDEDALELDDEEKEKLEQVKEESEELLEYAKTVLGDKVKEVRISSILRSQPVCITSDGPVTIEMEKYMLRRKDEGYGVHAELVLELNPESDAFYALDSAFNDGNMPLAEKYVNILYCQALLIAELPLEDPVAYTELVCSLMAQDEE